MIFPLTITTLATESCFNEFLLMGKSLELFEQEPINWVVACDEFVHQKLKDNQDVVALKVIEDDRGSDHNGSPAERKKFLDVIKGKFRAIEKAFELGLPNILFLDCDHIFLNPLPNIFQIFKGADAIASPHFSGNLAQIEHNYGLYNVGFLGIMNKDVLKPWESLTDNHEKLGYFFEQQPYEKTLQNFMTGTLPINFNFGWWRANLPGTQQRLNQICLKDDQIHLGHLPLIDVHAHAFKKPNGYDPSKVLIDKVFDLMRTSNNPKYKELISFYESLNK